MDNTEFRRVAHRFVEWIADYYQNIEGYPVSPQIKPGEVYNQLKQSPPQVGESIEDIFMDFERTIIPGMTHGQHPHFYGHYPAQNTYPSLLAEMLTLAMPSQSSTWHCSPAATELEIRVTDWLRQLLSLPETFVGVIQESASISTLVSILTARERWTQYHVGQKGLYRQKRFVVYASQESHPWLLKAMRIAGLGEEHLHLIAVDTDCAMNTDALKDQIDKDFKKGCVPLMIVATMGTHKTGAMDPFEKIIPLAKKNKIWLHVDAAYAGAALVLPEYQTLAEVLKEADSLVMDPHKWLLTSSECSVYFVRDVKALQKTLGVLSDYLPTEKSATMINYQDRGLGQGRRFRALKLWFVLREFGIEGLQRGIRHHLQLTQELLGKIQQSSDFELLAPVYFNMICFRYTPRKKMKPIEIDAFNHQLLDRLNTSGKIYLTPVDLQNHYGLRLVIGQTFVTHESINTAWQRIVLTAEQLSGEM